jgi:hypothetical protein
MITNDTIISTGRHNCYGCTKTCLDEDCIRVSMINLRKHYIDTKVYYFPAAVFVEEGRKLHPTAEVFFCIDCWIEKAGIERMFKREDVALNK